MDAFRLRQNGQHAIHRFDDIAPGCRKMYTITAGLSSTNADVAKILDRILHAGDVGERHRRAIAIGDHQRARTLRLHHLIGGARESRSVLVREASLGAIHVGGPERRAHVFAGPVPNY